jgi:hypothetical protein
MSYDFPAHESTRKRRRWGCTCGCVMLLILLIIIGGGIAYMGFKPHEEFPRYALMDGEVDGFGVFRMNPDDQGEQELSAFVLKRLQTASKANPGNAAQAKALSTLSKFSKNLLAQIFQTESMIYATYNPVTADENIIISAPLQNRFSWGVLREFLQNKLGLHPVGSDGIAQLYPLGRKDAKTTRMLSLDPDEVMISDSEPLLRKGLGYARDPNRNAIPSEKLQYFIDELALDQPPEGEDLAFALVNEESRITNLIFAFEELVGITGVSDRVAGALSAQKLTFADISGMKITGDLASADQLNVQLTMYCPNSDTATRLSKVFESALPQITGNHSTHGFKLEGKAVGRGVTVVVSIELTGLKAWIERLIPVAPEAESAAAQPAPIKSTGNSEATPAIAVETE